MYTPTYKECFDLTQVKDEFKMFDRGTYVVFDYVVAKTGTFDCKVSREMRGIAFDKDTHQIISRPLHKFFNLGERPETQADAINFETMGHQIVEKLDGSMIRTIDLGNGKYRLGTRAGVTDIAMMAEEFVSSKDPKTYDNFIKVMLLKGKTPIFEFCSRKNRVVIDHPEDRLVLLAVRENATGKYSSFGILSVYATLYGIEVAQMLLDQKSSLEDIAKTVKDLVGTEGVIVQFNDGFRIKIKAEDYLRKHGALDGFRSDKRTLELVLGSALDDVLPLLDAEMKDRIQRFRDHVLTSVEKFELKIDSYYSFINMNYDSRREQAMRILGDETMKPLAGWIFASLDGKTTDFAAELLKSSNQNSEKLCKLAGITAWSEFK